jgi:hypothetical protein
MPRFACTVTGAVARTATLATLALAAIAHVSLAAAQARGAGAAAPNALQGQDASLIGRPSPLTPDACAGLPLEWRLRCNGGATPGASEIGAPYGTASDYASDSTNDPAQPTSWQAHWQPAAEPARTDLPRDPVQPALPALLR